MLRGISLFLASIGDWVPPAIRLLNRDFRPAYMTGSRSRQTGIAKARREKRRRRAKK